MKVDKDELGQEVGSFKRIPTLIEGEKYEY